MIIIRCDRCKKEIENYPYVTIKIAEHRDPRNFLLATVGINPKNDIEQLREEPVFCMECAGKIKTFINNMGDQ